ncbi:hypothetical protein [Aminobacter sp. J44]|nr:hypothetical protein [Aminobacter sp. J44]TWG49651.1 hypothetical protein L610_000700000970 [Aminobacter sp. J44]
MSRDTLRAHEEHLEELREKEFQKFIEDFHRQFGEEPKEDSWIYD